MILQRTLLSASLHHQIAVGQLIHGAMLVDVSFVSVSLFRPPHRQRPDELPVSLQEESASERRHHNKGQYGAAGLQAGPHRQQHQPPPGHHEVHHRQGRPGDPGCGEAGRIPRDNRACLDDRHEVDVPLSPSLRGKPT